MRVLIAGSLESEDESYRTTFQNACREIGKKLGSMGAGLVLGSDNPKTADCYVYDGYASTSTTGDILVIRPESGDAPFAKQTRCKVRYDRRKGQWATIRVHEVLNADLVLVIAGKTGSNLVAQTAIALEKPMLAIPCFSGVGKDLFNEFEREYRTLPNSDSALGVLKEVWSQDHPAAIETLLRAVLKHNPFARQPVKPALFLLLGTATLLLAWLWLLRGPLGDFFPNVDSLFGMLAISSLLGTVMSHTVRKFANPVAHISLTSLIIHASVAVTLGFALTLVFLLGGLGITGDWQFLLKKDPRDLLRLGVILSTIGFAAGYLVEDSESNLRNSLQRILSPK